MHYIYSLEEQTLSIFLINIGNRFSVSKFVKFNKSLNFMMIGVLIWAYFIVWKQSPWNLERPLDLLSIVDENVWGNKIFSLQVQFSKFIKINKFSYIVELISFLLQSVQNFKLLSILRNLPVSVGSLWFFCSEFYKSSLTNPVIGAFTWIFYRTVPFLINWFFSVSLTVCFFLISYQLFSCTLVVV